MNKYIVVLLLALLNIGCGNKKELTTSQSKPMPANAVSSILQPENKTIENTDDGFYGTQSCLVCHKEQHQYWQGSHHDLAMQAANSNTVLGNFDNGEFDYYGTVSKFYKKDEQYFVKTDGPDGKLHEYRIAYTFGVYPLQQYLIEFPDGKLQALNIVWDSRTETDGGQRWYHLYPNEEIEYNDELHWTGINHNWNFMCADCHSTNLQKNYNHITRNYDTTWSDINVGCEACHGPGEKHIAWAQKPTDTIKHKGLATTLSTGQQTPWEIDPLTGNAKPQPERPLASEINVCARCHARRATGFADTLPQHKFLEDFRPALLTEPLYYSDGQIKDEVYVYGSFIQSKMYHAGVTCSNCHEPHSLKLRIEGNGVCAQCHSAEKYNSQEHHFHPVESAGAQCINCHMPTNTYMGIDERHDHSFRIPRPDISETLNTPNACTQCHQDQTDLWAKQVLIKHHGANTRPHFAQAIYAGQHGLPNAESLLTQLINDYDQPAIARATALSLLPSFLSQQSAPLLQMAAHDKDPLIGLGLVSGLEKIPPQYRAAFAVPMLYDEHRINRSLAARSLTGVSLEQFPDKTLELYERAREENIASEIFNADRPESLVNLANAYLRESNFKKAENFYKQALEIAPHYAPAYINFSNYLRLKGDDKKGKELLLQGLTAVHNPAPLNFSLGLLLVRQQQHQQALTYFQRATESPLATAQYFYVYGVALNSAGQHAKAIEVLQSALDKFPYDQTLKSAMNSFKNENIQ